MAIQAAIGPDPAEPRIAIPDQAQTEFLAGTRAVRKAVSRLDDLVVEIRRPQGQLAFLERQKPVVVPGKLPEHRKGYGMAVQCAPVRFLRGANLAEKIRME